jgi:hypothetical protein
LNDLGYKKQHDRARPTGRDGSTIPALPLLHAPD